MISFCGIVCSECPAFLARKDNWDLERKREIAEKWAKQFDHSGLTAEDISCEGCLSDSENVFSHCKECEIRACGKEKALKNCAYCSEYACAKLKEFFKHSPDCKKVLDEIQVQR